MVGYLLIIEIPQKKIERILGTFRSSLTTIRAVNPFSFAWGMIFFKSNPLRTRISEFGISL